MANRENNTQLIKTYDWNGAHSGNLNIKHTNISENNHLNLPDK